MTPHKGTWEVLSYNAQVHAVHAMLLHTGKILYFDDEPPINGDITIESRLWDPNANPPIVTRLVPPWPIPTNDKPYIFCGGHNSLSDGKIIAVGGHRPTLDPNNQNFEGLKFTYIFDPDAIDPGTGGQGTWYAAGLSSNPHTMNDGRWYPTAVRLGNKVPFGDLGYEIIAISGYRYDAINTINTNVEFYKPFVAPTGWAAVDPNMNKELPLYVGAYLIPYGPYAGEIFYDIHGWFITQPFSQGQAWRFNPEAASNWWNPVAAQRPFRNQGLSFPLPLFPGSQSFKVVNSSGIVFTNGETGISNTGEVIDLSTSNPAWSSIPNIAYPRWHANSPILPDGRVLIVCGNQGTGDYNLPVYIPEMFDAETMNWVNWDLAEMQHIPRGYHSNAVVLEDGSVWVTGGDYDIDPSVTLQIQIYKPGYFYESVSRPTILNAPTNISYGQSFNILTDSNIDSIALLSPGSVTHTVNFGQRYIGLKVPPAVVNGGYGYNNIIAPANRNVAPPGYYMLFVCKPKSASDSGQYRIPSVAHWVKLS